LLKGFEKLEKTSQLSLLDYETLSAEDGEKENQSSETESPILKELSSIQVTQMTPIQALQKLAEWQENLPKLN
jgi:DNA mismatch repair ATPase MutS